MFPTIFPRSRRKLPLTLPAASLSASAARLPGAPPGASRPPTALGGTGAMFLMIALMLPAFFMAMYERDGLPFEKVARNIIRAKFLRPGVRPYQTQNIYAPFAGKEVTLEQKPQEVKKPDAGR